MASVWEIKASSNSHSGDSNGPTQSDRTPERSPTGGLADSQGVKRRRMSQSSGKMQVEKETLRQALQHARQQRKHRSRSLAGRVFGGIIEEVRASTQVKRNTAGKHMPTRDLFGMSFPMPHLHVTIDDEEDNDEERDLRDELFYDLIYVAALMKLGSLMHSHVTWQRLGECLILFSLLWTTWFHNTMLYTRFCIPSPWRMLDTVILGGTLFLAVHTVDLREAILFTEGSKNSDAHIVEYIMHDSVFITGVGISVLVTRAVFMLTYLFIARVDRRARSLSLKYALGFLISCMMWIIATVIGNGLEEFRGLGANTVEMLWLFSGIVEMLVYPIVAMFPADRLPINVSHSMERIMLWTVLVLGESIISLVLPQLTCECKVGRYLAIGFGLLLVHSLFRMYVNVQPCHDSSVERHALQDNFLLGWLWCILHGLMTFCMFLVGVSIRLVVVHSTDRYFTRAYAWLFTGSLCAALVFINMIRSLHTWLPLLLFGKSWPRSVLWLCLGVAAFPVLALPLLVSESHPPKLDGEGLYTATQHALQASNGSLTFYDLADAIVDEEHHQAEHHHVEASYVDPWHLVLILFVYTQLLRFGELLAMWRQAVLALRSLMAEHSGDQYPLTALGGPEQRRRLDKEEEDRMERAGFWNPSRMLHSALAESSTELLRSQQAREREKHRSRGASTWIRNHFGDFAGKKLAVAPAVKKQEATKAHHQWKEDQASLKTRSEKHGGRGILHASQLAWVLHSHQGFQNCCRSELLAAARLFEPRAMVRGDVLFAQGQRVDRLFVMGTGTLCKTVLMSNKSIQIDCLCAGDIVDGLDSREMTYTLTATSNALVWQLDRWSYHSFREQHKHFLTANVGNRGNRLPRSKSADQIATQRQRYKRDVLHRRHMSWSHDIFFHTARDFHDAAFELAPWIVKKLHLVAMQAKVRCMTRRLEQKAEEFFRESGRVHQMRNAGGRHAHFSNMIASFDGHRAPRTHRRNESHDGSKASSAAPSDSKGNEQPHHQHLLTSVQKFMQHHPSAAPCAWHAGSPCRSQLALPQHVDPDDLSPRTIEEDFDESGDSSTRPTQLRPGMVTAPKHGRVRIGTTLSPPPSRQGRRQHHLKSVEHAPTNATVVDIEAMSYRSLEGVMIEPLHAPSQPQPDSAQQVEATRVTGERQKSKEELVFTNQENEQLMESIV